MAKTSPQDQHRYRSDLLAELKRDADDIDAAKADDCVSDETDSDNESQDAAAKADALPPMRRAEDRALYGSDPYLSDLAKTCKDRA